jgi:AraC-like DNA-binding protein
MQGGVFLQEVRDQKQWYGRTAQIIYNNEDYTIENYDCNGKGIVITYQVFDGIQIVFMEFHSEDTFTPVTPHSDVIEISWCRKGRVECEFANQTYSHLSEGDFWIDGGNYLPIDYFFPFGYFDAITLVIDKRALTRKSKEILASFSIDIEKAGNMLDLDKSWYICRSDENLKHLFNEIYVAKQKESVQYFSIKALELLYHIEQLSKDNGTEIKYYSKEQVQAVKNIWKYLTIHLDEKYSLEEVVRTENISTTMFQTIFGQMYGDSPYSYLKKYKMGIATKLLLDGKKKIGEIALALGYSNASKFTAAFKDVFGILPKDYRKSNC